MSLRDQLLAKGLVSKKRARSADRDKKRDRKREKGARDKKRVREAAEREAQEVAAAKRRDEQQAQRARYAQERERMERALQVRQILSHHRMKTRGRIAYHHISAKVGVVCRLWVDEATAFRLRNGTLAIVLDRERDGYAVVSAEIAERLNAIAEGLVVWHVQDTSGLAAPELALHPYDGEVCLQAHRWVGQSSHQASR